MLAQRGWRVNLYDALPAPPAASDAAWGAGERSYQLGLNGRGQKALREFGCMERVDKYAASVNGRLSFAADTSAGADAFSETRFKPPGTPGAEKNYVTRVMQRDRLQAVLLEEAAERYGDAIHVTHGASCVGVRMHGDRPELELRLCEPVDGLRGPEGAEPGVEPDGCEVQDEDDIYAPRTDLRTAEYDLIVGADGVQSRVRDALCFAPGSATRVERFVDTNERRYKTIPFHPSAVAGTPSDLNWGYQNKSLGLGMDALPTMEGEMVGVLLFKPGSKVYETVNDLKDGEAAARFFAEAMPPLVPYLRADELQRFVRRPISRLPRFQLLEGPLHRSLPKGAVLLLGDAIKAVKPYFGQGANSALEDVAVLGRCLDEAADDPAAAAAAFTDARAEDARALVRISRSFDGAGRLGTARFVLPLLLDIQLNKLLPWLFSPPTLRALQDERNAFAALARRKQYERVVLAGLVVAAAALLRVALVCLGAWRRTVLA